MTSQLVELAPSFYSVAGHHLVKMCLINVADCILWVSIPFTVKFNHSKSADYDTLDLFFILTSTIYLFWLETKRLNNCHFIKITYINFRNHFILYCLSLLLYRVEASSTPEPADGIWPPVPSDVPGGARGRWTKDRLRRTGPDLGHERSHPGVLAAVWGARPGAPDSASGAHRDDVREHDFGGEGADGARPECHRELLRPRQAGVVRGGTEWWLLNTESLGYWS